MVHGQWGTVCDDRSDGVNIGSREAKVICRMLGYNQGIAKTNPNFNRLEPYFGQGSGPIWIDGLECIGTESDINDCEFNKSPDCYHTEDVGVICS